MKKDIILSVKMGLCWGVIGLCLIALYYLTLPIAFIDARLAIIFIMVMASIIAAMVFLSVKIWKKIGAGEERCKPDEVKRKGTKRHLAYFISMAALVLLCFSILYSLFGRMIEAILGAFIGLALNEVIFYWLDALMARYIHWRTKDRTAGPDDGEAT